MAKDPKPARIRARRDSGKEKPHADEPGAASRHSAQSTTSSPNAGRAPLKPVLKLHKDLTHSVTKESRKKDYESAHRRCFKVMDNLEQEFQKALGERDEEIANNSQLMERLRTEKTQEISKLQQVIAGREKALVESRRLEKELCQLQQQVESTNATMQDQVSWNDIQLLLHQTHGELVSATTRFWNTIDALQNRRLAAYLPGSGVIHGNWPDQSGPPGALSLSQNTLPGGFSASSNLPLVTQQAPAPTNQYGSLV
ncbi:hypothetical protein N7510_002694 [Penicillium lagena]|uniref:uncharacterized protein n=1 Tax=Penicillium lagena TaxID=94218 RepID=UPI00253FAD21|nr:uncharacterized protein N7510_002694 [Penicillium lagena]KAJ5626385.1 hypothetical protein N7510_002694 [Penicillium lagena]